LKQKNRLLLVKDIVTKPFLFLAGDVLTPDTVLERIASRFEIEQAQKGTKTIGVIGGASNHTPAFTHAVLSVHDGYLQSIQHPPPSTYEKGALREMHRTFYSVDFLEFAEASSERLLSRIIGEIITETDRKFGVEEFDGEWAEYAEPKDIVNYQNLPFLKK